MISDALWENLRITRAGRRLVDIPDDFRFFKAKEYEKKDHGELRAGFTFPGQYLQYQLR